MVDSFELLSRAKAYALADEALRACWHLVVKGIEAGWLDEDELHELVQHLRASRDFRVEEISFAQTGELLYVSFLDDRASCSPTGMVAALSRLLDQPINT